jgi:hypothetical protein
LISATSPKVRLLSPLKPGSVITALLRIDVQNGFCSGDALAMAHAVEILPGLHADGFLAAAWRQMAEAGVRRA